MKYYYKQGWGIARKPNSSLQRALFLILSLGQLGYKTCSAQDKQRQPKVVLDLEKPTASSNPLAPRFGMTCHSSVDGYRELDRPASILELMGAPVEVVRVRRYRDHWKNSDEVLNHVIKIVAARTVTVFKDVPWAEFVSPDIVATIQFSDKVEGTLEESGGHVCFSDHSQSAWWLRGGPIK